MKQKAPLVLTEIVIMILIFAIAAAISLQAFALSEQMSKRSAITEKAITYAVSAAETVKAGKGDMDKAATILGGSIADEGFTAENNGLMLEVSHMPNVDPLLDGALITVTDSSGKELFSLRPVWQKEAAHE